MKSLLFVPASKPERFLKALNAGASDIIIDLEDALNDEEKQAGRDNIKAFLHQKDNASFYIRINEVSSFHFEDDLKLLKEILKSKLLKGVVLPKTNTKEDVEMLNYKLEASTTIIPLIESAKAILNLSLIASVENVSRLSFGSLDMALDLGLKDVESSNKSLNGKEFFLQNLMVQIALTSKACNLLAPINGVYPSFSDEVGLRANMELARGMGFGASLCIHPKQVGIINDVFSYTEEEVAWAKKILSLAKEHENRVFKFNGEMIDLPVIKKAQDIIDSF